MPKHHSKAPSSRLNAVASAAAIFITLCSHSLVSQAQSVKLPQGGTYQRGAGDITTNGNSTQINTTNAPGKVAVINWGGGFNVGTGGQVTFNNGTNANSLNAINLDPTGKTSIVNGAINGTGKGMNILVVNPNGVSLGSGARINTTGAFSAVAGTIDPVSIAPGQAGTVNIVLGNAPVIVNAAAAGQSSALGKLDVGSDKAISMTAHSAATLPSVIGSADINITGPGAITGTGNVAAGGNSYKLNTAGSLNFTNASIAASTDISISAKEVNLAATQVNAAAEGASVKIGGGARGKDASIANAQLTNIDSTSSITTGANSSVVVWGDKANFEGHILNPGGNAEISGKQIAYSGKTDLRGPTKTGTLLFDPDDILITPTGGPYTFQGFGTNGTSIISGAAISSALQLSSVQLEAHNSIVVQDAITSVTPGSGLSMETGGLLSIGAKIDIKGSFDGLVSTRSLTAPTAAPEIRMTPGGSISTNGNYIKLTNQGVQSSAFNAIGGTALVNGVEYQGSLLNAAGGNISINVGALSTTGLDIKTAGSGNIIVNSNSGGAQINHQQQSNLSNVTNIGEGGVWSTQKGELRVSSSSNATPLYLRGPTFKTYAGSGETGGNISISGNHAMHATPSDTGEKPLQIVAGGSIDAVKTGDIFYASRPFYASETSGATIYSGPQNNPNGTAGAINVKPGSIHIGGYGLVGSSMRLHDTQVSNRVSWGTNAQSAPLTINGYSVLTSTLGPATQFSSNSSNGGFFAEGNWYAAGAAPSLGKPETILSSRPGNYSYTPFVSSGDMALTNMQLAQINGIDSGGKLDITHNQIYTTATSTNLDNLKSKGDMTINLGNMAFTTIGSAQSGGKLSIDGTRGVKFTDPITAVNSVSLWNKDMTGNAANAFKFLPGATITSAATTGESMALAAFNFATGFDFGGQPLPLIAPGGRWAYYFTDPSGISADPLFGPAQTFHRYNCTYGGSAGACANSDAPLVPATGTAYLYAHTPVLTVGSPTLSTTYGANPNYTTNQTVSGYLGADAGIDAVTGTMGVTGGTYSTSGNLQAGTQSMAYSNGLASELGYKFSGTQFDVNVAKKEINLVGGVTSANKEYDGTTAANLNTTNALLSGTASGDILAVSATGTFDNKNAGINKTVTLSNAAIGGADGANYTFAPSANQSNTQASITQKTVTVDSGITLNDKVYDGTAQAVANTSAGVITGVIAADVGAVSVSAAAGNYTDKNVGINKVAALSNFVLSGAESGNYSVDTIASQASAIGNVTQKTITVASLGGATKVYDGTTATTGVAVLSGVIASDGIAGTAAGSFDNKNVGVNKGVAYGNTTLSGSDAANYALVSSGNATSGTANITPKSITIDSGLTVGKVYDGSSTVVANGTSAVISGRVGTDAVVASSVSGTFTDKNAGIGKTATFSAYGLSGADSNNYVVDTAASQKAAIGDIAQKSVAFVSGFNADKVYDGTTTAVVNTAAVVISGKVAGDNITANANGAFTDKNAGANKTVNLSNLAISGVDASNYKVDAGASQTTALATISQKVINVVSGLTAENKTYDGTTAATLNGSSAVLSGKIAGDDVSATATGAFQDKNADFGKIVAVTGYGVTGADAGNYAVTNTGNQASMTANIAQKAVSVGGGSIAGVDKVYDGNTNAQIAVNGTVVNGKILGDALTVNATGTFDNKNAGADKSVTFGAYGITGADASNYNIVASNPPSSGTTASITARPVSVTGVLINDKTFDGTTATSGNAAGASVSGLLAGDAVAVNNGSVNVNFINANVGADKGVTYAGSNILTGADANNYAVTQTPIPGAPGTGTIFAAGPPVVPPVVPPVAPPAAEQPRTTTTSVFGDWVVRSGPSNMQATSPELGNAGSLTMSSGPLSTVGSGATPTEVCVVQAINLGQKPSDAIKQCSVIAVPKSTR